MTDTPNQNAGSTPENSLLPAAEDIRAKPESTPAAAIPKQGGSETGGVSFITAAVIACAFSAFASFLSYHYATVNQPTGPQVVLVDGTKLANAQMKQTLAKPNMTPELAQADGLTFVTELESALKPFTDAGIVVVNSSVVLNNPEGTNITVQVAQHLGLTLE